MSGSRNVHDEETALLSYFVTAPREDVFFVYDTVPPESFAALGASFSRTHQSFQERLLEAVHNKEILKPEPARPLCGMFTEIDWEANRAGAFVKKWAQAYGHNSIKEMGSLRLVVENIPDLSGKIITGHPLAHPQVTSSRYVDWDAVLDQAKTHPDIVAHPFADAMITALHDLGETYRLVTDRLERFVRTHDDNEPYERHVLDNNPRTGHEKFADVARKSVFDYARYLLPPAVPTQMACQIDCRALEEVISEFLSSPLCAEQELGQRIWDEAKKVAPVLMGEKAHIARSDYQAGMREAFAELLPELFPFEADGAFDAGERTRFYDEVSMGTDEQIAASIVWQYGHGSFAQYHAALQNDPAAVRKVFDVLASLRGEHDPLPHGALHGGLMFETLMDYGADRDLHRHRRGTWSTQRLTTAHGFEVPQIVRDAGLTEEFVAPLEQAAKVYALVAATDPHVAELIVPYAFRRRRLYTWTPGQQGYMAELRSKRPGHDSYRDIAWAVADHMAERAPLFARLWNIDRRAYPQHVVKAGRDAYDAALEACMGDAE